MIKGFQYMHFLGSQWGFRGNRTKRNFVCIGNSFYRSWDFEEFPGNTWVSYSRGGGRYQAGFLTGQTRKPPFTEWQSGLRPGLGEMTASLDGCFPTMH